MTHFPSQLKSVEDLRQLTDADEQACIQSDIELLELFTESGSRQAIELLVRRHSPMVAGVIRRVVSDRQTAEDAFQATFLVLLKSSKNIRKRPSLAAWLYGVAYRVACHARQKYVRSRLNRTGEETDVNTLAETEDPFAALARQLELEALDQELQKLPSALRDPLIEHYLLGHSAPEIADRMELSLSAVEGRLRRGRRVLRLSLAQRGISLSVVLAGTTWLEREAQTAHAGDWVKDLSDQILNGPSLDSINTRGIESIANLNILSYVQGELAMRSTTFIKTAGYIAASLSLAGAIGLTAWAIGQTGQDISRGLTATFAEASETELALDTNNDVVPNRIDLAAVPVLGQQGIGKAPDPPKVTSIQNWKKPDSSPPKWMLNPKGEFDAIEAMRDKLNLPFQPQYRNHTLSRVMEDLSERTGIPILIDDRSLEKLGVTREEKVDLILPRVTLRSVLHQILSPMELTYGVESEFIRITAKDEPSSQLVRVYDLSYFLPSSAYVPALVGTIKTSLNRANWDDDGGIDTISEFGSALVINCSEETHHEIEKLFYKVSQINPEHLTTQPKGENSK